MAKQGFCSIVNISSGAGLTGVPGYTGYVASKHAEIDLAKSAALGYAERGVRVNAVCPGLVNTPLIADMVTENPELYEHLVASHPWAVSPNRRRLPTRSLGWPPAWRYPWTGLPGALTRCPQEPRAASRRTIR